MGMAKSRDFKGVRYDYEWEDLNKAFNEAGSLRASEMHLRGQG